MISILTVPISSFIEYLLLNFFSLSLNNFPFFPQWFFHFSLNDFSIFAFSFNNFSSFPFFFNSIRPHLPELPLHQRNFPADFLEYSRLFPSILEISRDLFKLPCSVHTKYFSRHLCQRPRKKITKKNQWKKSIKKFVPKFVGRLRWLSYPSLHALSPCVTTYSICIHTHDTIEVFVCRATTVLYFSPCCFSDPTVAGAHRLNIRTNEAQNRTHQRAQPGNCVCDCVRACVCV